MTKNQHYIPQFYLKYFANENEQVYVYDKFNNNSFRSNVRNCAAERNFYDVPSEWTGSADSQCVEAGISKIESTYSQVLSELVQSTEKNIEFNISFKARITPFIIFQLIRTKKFREKLPFYNEPFCKSFLPRPKDVSFNTPTPENFKHAEAMFNVDAHIKILEILANYIWVIGINESKEPFLTSDAPVVKLSHHAQEVNSNLDFTDKGIEVILPLTPKIILTLCDRDYFHTCIENDCFCLPIDKKSINRYNALQLKNAYRFIYSRAKIWIEQNK